MSDFDLENKLKDIDNIQVEYENSETKIASIIKDLESLGEINKDSDPTDIEAYLSLYGKYEKAFNKSSKLYDQYGKAKKDYNKIIELPEFKRLSEEQEKLNTKAEDNAVLAKDLMEEYRIIGERWEQITTDVGFNASEGSFDPVYGGLQVYEDWRK